MDYYLDEQGFHAGSKLYVGDAVNVELTELGTLRYNKKIYHYPSGKFQVNLCSDKIYRVPVPRHNFDNLPRVITFEQLQARALKRSRTDNVLRAKSRLHQIVLSNEWNFFLTLTFNDDVVDASDIQKVAKKMQNWLKNQTQRTDIGYLLVPEYHKKNKRVHAHALIKGNLKLEDSGTFKVKGFKKPVTQATIDRYHAQDRVLYPVYNCKNWHYGFSTAIEVYGSPGRLANYVLKYITKQNDSIFGKSYWCSKNLKLYPDIELQKIPYQEFDESPGKVFYSRAAGCSFKYINRTGDFIEDMSDDEEVLKL